MKPRQFTQLRVNFLLFAAAAATEEKKRKKEREREREREREKGKKRKKERKGEKKKKRRVFVSPDACANIKQGGVLTRLLQLSGNNVVR